MTAIEDFAKDLRTVAAVTRRPQPKLTHAEVAAISDAARPYFEAYEAQIAELQAAVPGAGPAWYGYGNDGTEYTGDQKQEVLHQWMQDNEVPDEKGLLRATLGERGEGPRARGPITFYTFPSPNGIVALWVARSDNLPMLRGMVSSIVSDGDEDEE